MPKSYAGNDASWVATVPVPNKIDDRLDGLSEAKMSPAFKANADRTAYLRRVWPKSFYYAGSGNPLWSNSNSGKSDSVGAYVDVPECNVGDKVHVAAFASLKYTVNPPSSTNGNTLEIVALVGSGLGSVSYIPGARANTVWAGMLGAEWTLELSGVWTATQAGTARMCLSFTALNLETLNLDSLSMVATRYGAL